MNYKEFRGEIIEKEGDFFAKQIEVLFEKAADFAENGQLNDAVNVGLDALIFAKYSNVGSEIIELMGLIAQALLENNKAKLADKFFQMAMRNIDENDETYTADMDRFLDLKYNIDKALELSISASELPPLAAQK